MEPEIRRAIPEDAKLVALLGRITFRETFGHLFLDHRDELRAYLDTTFDVGKIGRSVCKPENAYWLAFVVGLPVGYAKLKQPSAPTDQGDQNAVQLQKIYILKEFLGQRLGAELLSHVLLEAKRRAPMLWLDVLRENERAITFYKKHGFFAIDEQTYSIGSQRFLFHLMAWKVA